MLRLPWAAPLLAMAAAPRGRRQPDGQADRDLLDRCRRGDPRAMQDLYRRHADRVYRRLTHLVGPAPEREDLLQEVFIALFARIGRYRGDASLATYLQRIAANKAYDHLRRRSRRQRTTPLQGDFEGQASPAASPEGEVRRAQEAALLWRSLDRLKPKKRIAFILRVVEGHTLEEIAQQVGASPAAVAQRIRHARLELTEMVQAAQEEEHAP